MEKILGLGLKYIPKPKDLSIQEVVHAVTRFSHCILWKDYFQNNPNCPDHVYDKRLVTPKTYSALPPPSMNSLKTLNILDFFKRDIYAICRENQVKNSNQYISRTVNKLLTSHPKVKFVSADKNLGLVALDLSHYHELVMQHLSDTVHYKVYPESPDFAVTSRICYERFTDSLQSAHPDIYKYLRKHTKFKVPLFHCLAKIHKTPPLKGRPIVGATNWVTTPVSIYLDKLLSDIVRTDAFPYIIYDTKGIIHTLSSLGPLQSDSWLVTLDIESLYTNIDNQRLSIILHPYGDILSKLFSFINKMNYCKYNRQLYRQRQGIAMGTNAAVQLANLYLGTLLDKLAASAHKGIILYKRYIDDIFLIFNGHHDELDEYIDSLDRLIPGIKLTRTYSQSEVNFLDITIYKDVDNHIQWKTFQKPTNKFLYIPFQSAHPRCTFSGFISAEIARLKLTNSDPWNVAFHVETFFEHLKARGYGRYYLERFRPKTRLPARVTSSQKEQQPIIPFVLRFTNTKRHDELCKIVLNYRTEFSDIFADHKLIIAHSSSPSIGKLLLRSKLSLAQSGLILDLTIPSANPGRPNLNRRPLTDIPDEDAPPVEAAPRLKKSRLALACVALFHPLLLLFYL